MSANGVDALSLSPLMAAKRPSELSVVVSGLKAACFKNFLPLAFAVAFVFALSWPWLGRQVVHPEVADVHVVTFINICIVFFISGLTLNTDQLKNALTKRTITGTAFAFASIVGLTPLLGFAMRHLPLHPEAFATGLTIFCVVPTTLGVGVSLVTSAKGNVALAIFLTVGTNILGVVFIPLWLKAMLSENSGGVDSLNINFVDIFVKLLISFLVPTLLGKALRDLVPAVNAFQKKYKKALSLTSNTMLAMLIWQTLSSGRDVIVDTATGDMLLVIVSTLLIHVFFLACNAAAVTLLRVPLPEAIAAVIMASQKSAPVAVTVITYMTRDTRTQGVLALPCVIGQLVQIFVGQPIAHYLAGIVARRAAAAAEDGDGKAGAAGGIASTRA